MWLGLFLRLAEKTLCFSFMGLGRATNTLYLTLSNGGLPCELRGSGARSTNGGPVSPEVELHARVMKEQTNTKHYRRITGRLLSLT